MANDKDKVKTSNPKSKDWEKRRRDKLGDAFKLLAQLLPHHDPAKLPSKIHILNRATEFIKELRLSNSRLLTTKNQPNEMSSKINELQDEVNKLILRVKQLTTLLDQAKIPIPQGPCIQSLGKREFKWSRKLTAEDVENLGILLNSGKPIKKNKKAKVTLHVTTIPKAQILEDNDNSSKTASTVKDKEVETRENDKTKSTDIEANKSVEILDILNSTSEQTKSNHSKPNVPLPAEFPASKESLEPIAVPPKTKIIVTNLSKKESSTDTQTTAKLTKEDVIANKKDLETVKCATIENKTVNSITISPSKSLSVTLLQPQLVTTSAPMIFTPLNLFSTGGMRHLAPLLPKVLPGVIQKLPISRIKREFVPKKIRAKRRKKKVEQTIVNQKEVDSVPAPTPVITKDLVPNSPPPEVITIVEEEPNADEAKQELEVNAPVVSSEEIKEATSSCTEPKITEQTVEEMEIGVDIEKLDNGRNKVHSPKEILSDNQVQPKESDKTGIVLEPSVPGTATTDNSNHPSQNSTKSLRCEVPVSNRELNSIPPVTAVEQIENIQRNNERNDVFNFNDENGSPSCTSPVKISECIARSIGISMEQDEVESDLMELNTDWTGVVDPSSSQSPKSCISPTQMFLSCFPLLPRDGNISSELPTQIQPNFIKSATLPSSNSRPSSFCINSMLPNDPNQIQPYTAIENPFTASSSLCKKILPPDSFEKVLAPLQTFKSSKLLPLPPTIPTTTTTSSNSLDLYSDKGLMWFSDYLNPVNKDSASTNTLSSTRTFPRIVSSQHEKQSVQSSTSEVRSLLSNPILKDHSNSKEISKPQGGGNSRAKYSKTQPQQASKDCALNAKEKELPRIPIPEHQPHFAFPIQTPKSSKSRTIQNPIITQQTAPQKQRQPQPYPYQSIQKIIDYQSPPVHNSAEYHTKFIPRTETVSHAQYPNPTTSSSRPSQLHSHSSAATTQFQHQPSLSKSSNQPSFSSNEYSRYSLHSYPQSNRNDTQTNQVTYPPPPVYQPSAPSRIPTSTGPLYLPPPVPPTPCENSTRAVVFPPSVPTNTNQRQMDYSQLGDTTYHADFSSHHSSNNSSVAMNPELNNYFGTNHHSHQNQNSKKQELRSAINTQISPRPVPNLASNRGASSNPVPSSSSSSQPQHYQHQRPVNWMTETRTTSKKGTSRGTSFSVSKLVDQPNPPAPIPTQQIPDKNYYTDVLLSKTSFSNRTGNYNSLEWAQPHYSTPTTNENPFMFQNTHQTTTQNPDPQHQHNFQLGFQDPNQSSYYPGNPTSHNQQHQVGLSTPQYFVDYGHVGQSTVNSVTPYQQNQHHYHNPHGSSVSNFNLSSLFPEIADKNPSKNHNTHMRNPNNNSNPSSTQNQNSLNLLDPYSANTIGSGLNNFSNIGIPPFSSGSTTGRKNQHHS